MAKTQQERKMRVTSVAWTPQAPVREDNEQIPLSREGGVQIDPFKDVKREAVVQDNHKIVRRAFEAGLIDFDTAMAALDKCDRANRSAGKGILHDQRLKPTTKAEKFMDYAMSIGMSREEAQARIMSEVTSSKKLAGRWGTISHPNGPTLEDIQRQLTEYEARKQDAQQQSGEPVYTEE